jgi:hypothetical protein
VAVEGAAAKSLRAALEVEPLTLDPTPASDFPRSVAAADLDGDGDLEIVAANQGSDCVTVFFQDSPGNFALPPFTLEPTPQQDLPVWVAAADLDGDGDLELVSANSAFLSDSVTVFFQDAPGSFGGAPLMLDPTPGDDDRPSSVVAADLDGDGDLELVSANAESDSLSVFFQNAPGSFGASPLVLPANANPVSAVAADLDGDGDLEIISANARGDSVGVFFQDAPGSFGAPTLTLDPSPHPFGAVSVAVADLDGDGDLELVSTNPDGVTVFFQDAPGRFSSPALALDPTPAVDQPSSVAAADLDRDGDLDLVSANGESDCVTVFFQDSLGSFAAPALALDATPAFDRPLSVAAADLDGDGDLEILSANEESDRVAVFFQDATLSLATTALALDFTPFTDQPRSVAPADLDGDGDLELVSANFVRDRVAVFFQSSLGDFSAPALGLDPTPRTDRPISVATADFDGDGDLELVSANQVSDSVTVFFQSSPGGFAVPALALDPTPASDQPRFVAAADLDGDGDLELVSANQASDSVTVFFQTSPGVSLSPCWRSTPPLPQISPRQ